MKSKKKKILNDHQSAILFFKKDYGCTRIKENIVLAVIRRDCDIPALTRAHGDLFLFSTVPLLAAC